MIDEDPDFGSLLADYLAATGWSVTKAAAAPDHAAPADLASVVLVLRPPAFDGLAECGRSGPPPLRCRSLPSRASAMPCSAHAPAGWARRWCSRGRSISRTLHEVSTVVPRAPFCRESLQATSMWRPATASLAQAEPSEHPIERRPVEAEDAGGAALVATDGFDHTDHVAPFELVECDQLIGICGDDERRVLVGANSIRKVVDP